MNAADAAIAQIRAASGDTLALISPPYIQPVPLPGDADLDGKVDVEDLTILLTNFGKSGGWGQGNFAGDATVDVEDMTILLAHFGESLPLPAVFPGNTNAAFIRGGSAIFVAPNLTLSDPNDRYLSSATVAIQGGPLDVGAEALSATTTGTNIRAGYNPLTGVLQLSGTDTLFDYQRVLRSVSYADTLGAAATQGARALDFTIGDAVSSSSTASSTVFVAAPLPGDANLDGTVDIEDLTILLTHFGQSGMPRSEGNFAGDPTVDIEDLTILLAHFGLSNGPPVISAGDAGAVTFVQGSPAVAVAPNLTVSDPESWTLSSATAAIGGGPLDAGAEWLAATTAGTNITASYNPATGILTLSGSDTPANYQKVLQSVTYKDTLATAAKLGGRTVTFTVGDGILTSAIAAAAVDVVA